MCKMSDLQSYLCLDSPTKTILSLSMHEHNTLYKYCDSHNKFTCTVLKSTPETYVKSNTTDFGVSPEIEKNQK